MLDCIKCHAEKWIYVQKYFIYSGWERPFWKVTFKQRPDGNEWVSHVDTLGEASHKVGLESLKVLCVYGFEKLWKQCAGEEWTWWRMVNDMFRVWAGKSYSTLSLEYMLIQKRNSNQHSHWNWCCSPVT